MAAEKKQFPLADFFTALFYNFPKLLLTNLLFAVPFAAVFAIFYFINSAAGINSNLFLMLGVIPIFPFYAGVTLVTSHMVRNEEGLRVAETFFRGIKENFLRFLVHGAVFYLALFFSYYSVVLYSGLGKTNHVFYGLLVISLLIAVFFLFIFYYIPPMTVTFDISMKNIYKNSVLMCFGELKHNIIATFGIAVLGLVFLTILLCCSDALLVVIITAVIALLLAPSLVSFIINSAVYSSMYAMIVDKDKKSREINKKIEDKQSGVSADNSQPLADIEIDESGDGNEYIFYNGKMIKRSVLISMKKQAQASEKSDDNV